MVYQVQINFTFIIRIKHKKYIKPIINDNISLAILYLSVKVSSLSSDHYLDPYIQSCLDISLLNLVSSSSSF